MAEVLTGKGYVITTTMAAGLTASGSQTITLIGVTVANIHATAGSWVTVDIVRSGGVNTELCHEIEVPVNDSLSVLQGKVVLNPNDAIHFDAEFVSHLEASLSYLVQT
tara:strand:+ start:270 stop:593 length:324 start_codon:yes stop_codon:yes gene_type:complete